MALPKPAQQFKCVARNVPITGTEHSAAFRAAYSNRTQAFVDEKLALYRDVGNLHDRYAVQLRARMSNESSKMGWIGMQTGHSEQIAKLMDALPNPYGSHIVVTRRAGALPPKFYGDVYLPDYGEEPKAPPPLSGRRVSHLFSQQGADTPIDLTPYIGKILLLATTTSRVSVTLTAANGDRLGWFRKSGLDDIDDWKVKAALVKGKSMIDLVDVNAVKHDGVVQCEVPKPGQVVANPHFKMQDQPYQKAMIDALEKKAEAEAERNIRTLLHIPETLRLQTGEDQQVWLISEDGDHWLHLIDQPFSLANMVARHAAARRYAFDNFEPHYPADFYLRKCTQLNISPALGTWAAGPPGHPNHAAKAAINAALEEARKQPQTQKETTMLNRTSIATILSANKQAATSAAYLEAGRIANNTFASFAAAKAPFMVKGYIDTPVGKLVLANIAAVAQRELRPNDLRLQRLVEAMSTQAFLAIYQDFDIEGQLEQLLANSTIKRALDKLEADAEVTEVKPAAKTK